MSNYLEICLHSHRSRRNYEETRWYDGNEKQLFLINSIEILIEQLDGMKISLITIL